jgi:hypothetical protein
MKKWDEETKSFIDGLILGGMLILAYNYLLTPVVGV